MSSGAIAYVVVGGLLLLVSVTSAKLKPLPMSNPMLYLLVGILVGPAWLAWVRLDPIDDAALLERAAEIVVIISLFTSGLRLRLKPSDPRWRGPVLLATGAMCATILLVSLLGVHLLGLPWGPAIVLGAVLAPTDPVLAADVHAGPVGQRDAVRFSLAGEAGLNDGTAFPFVVLGLALTGGGAIGDVLPRWIALDVVWATLAGIAVGGVFGTIFGRLVLFLRQADPAAKDLDDFLGLGLVAFSYGVALLVRGYGFLAVFAAGLALRYTEMRLSPGRTAPLAPRADHQPPAGQAQDAAEMTHTVLLFNEHLDRLAVVALVMLVGTLVGRLSAGARDAAFLVLLFMVVRPLSVAPFLRAIRTPQVQSILIGWFGIRGIGSIYYLAYAIRRGLPVEHAQHIAAVVISAIAISVLVHGITATPVMRWYGRR